MGSKQITSDGFPKFTLVGDANRLYFTENPPARDSIAQMSVNGGETAPSDVPFDNPIVADVSRQGSELLVTKAVLEGLDNPFGRCLSPPVRHAFSGKCPRTMPFGRPTGS